jgi:hypothetical protein
MTTFVIVSWNDIFDLLNKQKPLTTEYFPWRERTGEFYLHHSSYKSPFWAQFIFRREKLFFQFLFHIEFKQKRNQVFWTHWAQGWPMVLVHTSVCQQYLLLFRAYRRTGGIYNMTRQMVQIPGKKKFNFFFFHLFDRNRFVCMIWWNRGWIQSFPCRYPFHWNVFTKEPLTT